MKIVDIISSSKIVESKSEIKRMIKQGAIKIDDVVVSDIHFKIKADNDIIVKVGKRRFLKIVIQK